MVSIGTSTSIFWEKNLPLAAQNRDCPNVFHVRLELVEPGEAPFQKELMKAIAYGLDEVQICTKSDTNTEDVGPKNEDFG